MIEPKITSLLVLLMYREKLISATAQVWVQFSDITQFLLSDLSVKIITLWLNSVLSVEEINKRVKPIVSEVSFKSFKNRTIRTKMWQRGAFSSIWH